MLIEKEKEMLLSSSSFCRENIICPPLKPICTAHITNKSFIFPNAFFILYEYTFWVNKDTIPLLTTETKYSSSSFFSKASSFHKFCTCVVYRSCPSFPNIYRSSNTIYIVLATKSNGIAVDIVRFFVLFKFVKVMITNDIQSNINSLHLLTSISNNKSEFAGI